MPVGDIRETSPFLRFGVKVRRELCEEPNRRISRPLCGIVPKKAEPLSQ